MRKSIQQIREETDLAAKLLDYANTEEDDQSSQDGDDPTPVRRRGLACFIDVFAKMANTFRQVFGISHDSENLFSGEPETNQLDESIYDIVNTLPANSVYHGRVTD